MKRNYLRLAVVMVFLILSLMLFTSCSSGTVQEENPEPSAAVSETAESSAAADEGEEPSRAVSEPEQEPADTAEANTVTEVEEEADALAGYNVFSSELLNFSFLYDPAHTAYLTGAGTAELAIDGDERLVGLFVSVIEGEHMPTPEEILEEEIFNLQQKYQNAMAEQPEMDTEEIEGHTLTGIVYAYSDTEGKTVDCTEWIEVRDGKYIFYDTAAYRDQSGPELTALGIAMASLEFSADAWGPSDAKSGSIARDTTPVISETPADEDWGRSDSAPTYLDDMNSGFHFEADDSYLIISDENTTQVYVNGVMSGDYFACERVTLDSDIGNAVVQRQNEVLAFLQERVVTPPEVKMIEIGDRRIAGIEYSYSAADGSKTICGAEYYEYIGDEVYNWFTFYDKGTTKAPDALQKAMETFVVD